MKKSAGLASSLLVILAILIASRKRRVHEQSIRRGLQHSLSNLTATSKKMPVDAIRFATQDRTRTIESNAFHSTHYAAWRYFQRLYTKVGRYFSGIRYKWPMKCNHPGKESGQNPCLMSNCNSGNGCLTTVEFPASEEHEKQRLAA